MTRAIGLIGGGNITQLGTSDELDRFFDLVRHHCADLPREHLSAVTELLYRGNVRPDDFEDLESAWHSVFKCLDNVPADAAHTGHYQSEIAQEKLDWTANSLGAFFAAYREALLNAIEGARFEIADFGLDPRIRIGPASVPSYKTVEDMKDEDFDAAAPTPLWLQPGGSGEPS